MLRVSGTRARFAAIAARALAADARRLAGRSWVRYPGPGARARYAWVSGVDGGRILNRKIEDGSARQSRALFSSVSLVAITTALPEFVFVEHVD